MITLETNSVSKYFGETKALNNISIHVRQGEIYGFLGLNGAGKTTLIRILLGMIKASSGGIKLFGESLSSDFEYWNRVGYLVETPYSYPNLSVLENLKVFYQLRQLNDRNAIDSIIEKLKLKDYRNVKANHLSLGNQQRLGLAKALMHKPELLILDEPINGLDPEGIVEVRELLLDYAKSGSTVFLSSHILGEISKLANRVAIINKGTLIQELATEELFKQLMRKLIIKTHDNTRAVSILKENGISSVLQNSQLVLTDNEILNKPESVSKLLVENNIPPSELHTWVEDLEQYFLRTIKQPAL